MNYVLLSGRVGKDAEYKEVSNGGVLKFSIATSDKWKDKAGEWQEKTEWHNCYIYGKRAEALKDKIKKGNMATITGKVTYSVTEKDGVKNHYTNVVVSEIDFFETVKKEKAEDIF